MSKTIKHITKDDVAYQKRSEFVVEMPDCEVRNCVIVDQEWQDKKGVTQNTSFLQITVEQDDGEITAYLHDRDLSHADLYKRGTVGRFRLAVSVNEDYKGRTKLFVIDFVPEEEAGA